MIIQNYEKNNIIILQAINFTKMLIINVGKLELIVILFIQFF